MGELVGAHTIDPDLAERVNRILRPADDVCTVSVMCALLDTIDAQPTDDAKRAVLTHALDVQWCAEWSGAPTPASEYPEHTCACTVEHDPNDGVHQGLNLYVAYLELEMAPTAEVVGRRAWEFLQPFSKREHKIHALVHIMGELEDKVEPAREVLQHEASVPNEERYPILWTHRQILRGILFRGNKSDSFTGSGEALLRGIAEIEDERERAIVAGYALQMMLEHRLAKVAAHASAQGIASSVLSALFGGKGGVLDILILGSRPPQP